MTCGRVFKARRKQATYVRRIDMADACMKEFQDRWQAVAAIEMEEQRTASVALRWQQINALWRMAVGLGLPLTKSDEQEEAVRRRWAKLKELAE